MEKLSIIIPVFNEEGSIQELHTRIASALEHGLKNQPYEIVFINDGSTDKTREIMSGIETQDGHTRAIHLPTNSGKSEALATGFSQASGDIIVTLDGDLQDRPENIPQLIQALDEGYDLVVGWKKIRHDPLEKVILSKIFNACVRMAWRIPLHDINCGMKAMKRPVAGHLQQLAGDGHRFIPVIAKNLGFRITEIPITHDARKYGVSKYGWRRLISGYTSFLALLFFGNVSSKSQRMVAAASIAGLLAITSTCIATIL